MLKIVTCFKWVIDEADIKVESGSQKLNLDRVGYKISEYDRNALEEAARLKERHGGSVAAVTVGAPTAKKGLKDALSRGPDQVYFVNDPAFADLEPAQTASLLAAVIGSRVEYDLIICGEGSSDLYSQQVGPRLAEKLGIPVVTYVSGLTIEGSQVTAERKLDDGIEVVSVQLPALVTVLPDINTPRIPGLRDTMDASRKPVTSITAADLGPPVEPLLRTVGMRGAAMERSCVKTGPDEKEIQQLIDRLLSQGVVG